MLHHDARSSSPTRRLGRRGRRLTRRCEARGGQRAAWRPRHAHGWRVEDEDDKAGAAGVRLTSTTLAEDDGGMAAGKQLDAAVEDAQGDEDGGDARPLPRHLLKPTTTSAREATGVQPGAYGRRQR
jgi:hypothetical protein